MYFLVYLGGVAIGSIMMCMIFGLRETYGKLLIDPREDTCQILINSEKAIKKRTKRIVLIVDHHADLSQK